MRKQIILRAWNGFAILLTIIGLAGVPDDLRGWAGWLKSLGTLMDHESARWLFVIVGVALIALSWCPWKKWLGGPPAPRVVARATEPATAPLATAQNPPVESPEVYDETPKRKRTRQKIDCKVCRGTGKANKHFPDPCPTCHGDKHIFTYRVGQPVCYNCNGDGRSNPYFCEPCSVCQGTGLMPFKVDDQG